MLFIQMLSSNPQMYIIWILLVIFSVCCHEYAHARMALWLGDHTAAENGYLTFNPLKVMGLWSLIALFLIGITWGAVPVNPRNLRKKHDYLLVSSAGILVNLALFLVFSFGAAITYIKNESLGQSYKILFQFFYTGGTLNAVLFLFNLLPIPPLDGWNILCDLFPGIYKINSELRNGLIFGLFALIFFAFNKLFLLGSYAVYLVITITTTVFS